MRFVISRTQALRMAKANKERKRTVHMRRDLRNLAFMQIVIAHRNDWLTARAARLPFGQT